MGGVEPRKVRHFFDRSGYIGPAAKPITRIFTTKPQLLVTSRVVAVVALLSVGRNDHGEVVPDRAPRYSLGLIA